MGTEDRGEAVNIQEVEEKDPEQEQEVKDVGDKGEDITNAITSDERSGAKTETRYANLEA